jgi:hypothetical protein
LLADNFEVKRRRGEDLEWRALSPSAEIMVGEGLREDWRVSAMDYRRMKHVVTRIGFACLGLLFGSD